jgi:hypothetical protein
MIHDAAVFDGARRFARAWKVWRALEEWTWGYKVASLSWRPRAKGWGGP